MTAQPSAISLGSRIGGSRSVRLCLISYTPLSRLANSVLSEFAGRAEIEVFDGTFGTALEVASERERQGLVDAFVSAGGNAAVLRGAVKSPVATIVIDGFDLLMALIEARKYTKEVGVVTYERTVPELDTVRAILNIDIQQRIYRSYDEAGIAVRDLREMGITVVIGSSVVVEAAERQGLHAILAYSRTGIRRGFENAIELARVARLESNRYSLINGVLGSLREAVLAVDDAGRVIAANRPMEILLGSGASGMLGKFLADLAPELSPAALGERGADQGGHVLRFGNRDWIAHRSPIREDQGVSGVTLTSGSPQPKPLPNEAV